MTCQLLLCIRYLFLAAFDNLACYVYAAGTSLREATGYAGTVTNGKDVFEFRFQLIGEFYAGAVELDFDTIE